MRAAIYARFSSDQQNPRSCDDQVAHVTPFLERNGWRLVAVYRDDAVSGREILGRAGWQALLAAADSEPRPFDVVVCEDLDRWGRDFFAHLDGAGRLHRAGIAMADPSRGLIDLGSTAGRIVLSIAAATSAEVSQKISEHTRRGLKARIGYVSKPGGPAPYGFAVEERFGSRRDSRGRQVRESSRLVPDPDAAGVVRRIFELRTVDGLGIKALAKELTRAGVPSPKGSATWSPATVRGILMNPAYAGHTRVHRWQKRRDPVSGRAVNTKLPAGSESVVRDTHPGLVDEATWLAAQRELQDRPTGRRRDRQGHPLSGLLHCGACGGRMSILDRYGYGCRERSKGSGCQLEARFPVELVELQIRSWLESTEDDGAEQSYARLAAELGAQRALVREELAGARRRIASARQRQDRLAGVIAEHGATRALLEALQAAERAESLAQAQAEEIAGRLAAEPTPAIARANLRARMVEEWMRPGRIRELLSRIVCRPDRVLELQVSGRAIGWLSTATGQVRRSPESDRGGGPNGLPALYTVATLSVTRKSAA